MKYRIRFLRDERIERAPKDKTKGGHEYEYIKAGTIMEVNGASVNFWRGRGSIEVLPSETKPFTPFGINPATQDPPAPKMTKKALRELLLKASKALEENDGATLADVLTSIDWKDIDDQGLIEDLDNDSHMLITAASQDYAANGQTSVSGVELKEALDRAADVCLPKTKRILVTS